MKYAETVALRLKENGQKKTWLAEQLSLRYKEFWQKMSALKPTDGFTKEEKKKIDLLLGEDCPEKTNLIKSNRLSRDLKRMAKLVTEQSNINQINTQHNESKKHSKARRRSQKHT